VETTKSSRLDLPRKDAERFAARLVATIFGWSIARRLRKGQKIGGAFIHPGLSEERRETVLREHPIRDGVY